MKQLLFLLTLISPLYAETDSSSAHIKMGEVSAHKVDDVYQLNAQLEMLLSEEMQDALRNGVSQTYVMEVQVRVPRFQLYYHEVVSKKHRFELYFHALSRKYLVTHQNSILENKSLRSFYTLYAALEYMSRIDNLPILSDADLDDVDAKKMRLRVKFMLDVDKLPLPLQIHSLTNRAWRISSQWRGLEL